MTHVEQRSIVIDFLGGARNYEVHGTFMLTQNVYAAQNSIG